MRVLVAYGSRLGTTAEVAQRIAAGLGRSGVQAHAESADRTGDVAGYDAFVIGSGVYGGHWHAPTVEFVRANAGVLAAHPVWLFSCGPLGTNPNANRMEPIELREIDRLVQPREHRTFFGAFDRDRVDGSDLGLLERIVARTLIPEGDFRDWRAIDAWSDGIAMALARVPVLAG